MLSPGRPHRAGGNGEAGPSEDPAQGQGLNRQHEGLTSGLPFGKRNSSGTIFFICVFLSSVEGVGFALYSVREKLVNDGVLARPSSSCRAMWVCCACGCAVPLMPLVVAMSPALFVGQALAASGEDMIPAGTRDNSECRCVTDVVVREFRSRP